MSAALLGINGSASAPAFAFASDVDTGMFRESADTLGFATQGVRRAAILSGGAVHLGTSALAPPDWTLLSSDRLRVGGTSGSNSESLSVIGAIRGILLLGGHVNTTNGSQNAIKFLSTRRSTTDENNAAVAMIVNGLNNGSSTGGGDLRFHTRPNDGELTERVIIGSDGNLTVKAPSSGFHVIFNSGPGALTLSGTTTTDFEVTDGTRRTYLGATSTYGYVGSRTNHAFRIFTNDTERIGIGSSGNVTVNAPASGVSLTANVGSGGTPLRITDGTVTGDFTLFGTRLSLGTTTNHEFRIFTNNTDRFRVLAGGNVIVNQPASGYATEINSVGNVQAVLINTPSSTWSGLLLARNGIAQWSLLNNYDAADEFAIYSHDVASSVLRVAANGSIITRNSNAAEVGFKGAPVNSQSSNYTLVLADTGRTILFPSGSGSGVTYTIPANSSVAFPVGTTICIANRSSNNLSIAITTDTLVWAGVGSTGTRTLASNGLATITKVESTVWLISGSGLS
ncbi:MAG: hypothetical protein NZ534_00005 [Bacteroidia bacterium]|nr:hypothetical protein [Bacteroidia bacterium]